MGLYSKGGSEKTKPNKANFGFMKAHYDVMNTIQELFRGLDCLKGYTALYVKLEFYEFWEVNHEKQ